MSMEGEPTWLSVNFARVCSFCLCPARLSFSLCAARTPGGGRTAIDKIRYCGCGAQPVTFPRIGLLWPAGTPSGGRVWGCGWS